MEQMNNLLLNYEQMAALFSVDAGTIRTWVSQNKIPQKAIFKMPGKKGAIRFIRSGIENWINGVA